MDGHYLKYHLSPLSHHHCTCWRAEQNTSQKKHWAHFPWTQSSWSQHGAHLGPVGPRLAPCWPHEPCYQGYYRSLPVSRLCIRCLLAQNLVRTVCNGSWIDAYVSRVLCDTLLQLACNVCFFRCCMYKIENPHKRHILIWVPDTLMPSDTFQQVTQVSISHFNDTYVILLKVHSLWIVSTATIRGNQVFYVVSDNGPHCINRMNSMKHNWCKTRHKTLNLHIVPGKLVFNSGYL